DDQFPAQHAHLTLELVLAGRIGHQLNRYGFAFGQFGALVEVREEHHLRAHSRLGADEVQPHRLAPLDDDHLRGVAALDQDHRLLVAAGGEARFDAFLLGEPEEPDDEHNGGEAAERNDNFIRRHGIPPFWLLVGALWTNGNPTSLSRLPALEPV